MECYEWWKDPGWVLGGIERPIYAGEIPRMFLVLVPDRKKETLQAMLQKWVYPGSIVVTDSFKSYHGLSQLGFYHYSVNHKKFFVAPGTGAHTQRIEGAWSHIRKEAFPLVGCRLHDVSFFLAAYLYRRMRQGSIAALLQDIKQFTPEIVMRYETRHQQIQPNSTNQITSPDERKPKDSDKSTKSTEEDSQKKPF